MGLWRAMLETPDWQRGRGKRNWQLQEQTTHTKNNNHDIKLHVQVHVYHKLAYNASFFLLFSSTCTLYTTNVTKVEAYNNTVYSIHVSSVSLYT